MTVSGEVDVYTAPQLRSALEERIAAGQTALIVDLEDVGFLDSTGLGVLVGRLKAVKKVDGWLRVVCTNERILRLFGITGLDQVLPIHDTVDAALAAGRRRRRRARRLRLTQAPTRAPTSVRAVTPELRGLHVT